MDVRLCAGECRSSDFKPYGPLLSIPLLVGYHEVNMDCPSRNGFSKVSHSLVCSVPLLFTYMETCSNEFIVRLILSKARM
jgi:hypothetical protein